MDFYERALELKEETIENRRYIHEHAETGLYLPKTKEYVINKLQEYGLDPKPCGEGVTATLGHGGKVLLLRADNVLCFVQTWMLFRCRKKAMSHLPARPVMRMPVAMIFMQLCF